MRAIDGDALIDKYGDWYTEEGTEEGYIGTIKGIDTWVAKKRAENSALQEIQNSVSGYDTLSVSNKNIRVINDKVTYAFMPVWVLSTKWRDKNYIFAMNGQTGKMVGDLPVDKGKFWGYFFGITAIVAAIVTPIVYFFF